VAADRALREGIPVTSWARTLLDLAGILTVRRLARAIEQAERLELFHLVAIEELRSRSSGKRGVRALRASLAEYREPPFTRSELERRFLALVRRAGLRTPSANLSSPATRSTCFGAPSVSASSSTRTS
jgi:hypothetical protein